MGVAVKQEIEAAAVFQIVEQALIVAMNPGDSPPLHLQVPERLMQSRADCSDRLPKPVTVKIAVSEDEMCLKTSEQPDRRAILDVTTVEHAVDVPIADEVKCFA